MAHHHGVAVHWPPDHRMVHDSLSRHFGLLWGFRLVHHRLRGFWSLHRPLRHHRLLLLHALLLLLLLGVALVAAWVAVLLLAAALLLAVVAVVLLLRLWLVADLGSRVDHRVGSRLVLKVVFVVRSHRVDAQSVPSLASLLAVRALVDEPCDMCLNVLFHSRSDLGGEVTLGALPRGFADGGVVVGDHQLGHLPVQLQVHLSWHLADHLGSLFPRPILLLLLLWLELHPPSSSSSSSSTSSHWTLRNRAMTWAGVVALGVSSHPLRRLHHRPWLVLLDHVSSQGVPRLEDLVALSALVDNTGNVGLNVLLHLRGEMDVIDVM